MNTLMIKVPCRSHLIFKTVQNSLENEIVKERCVPGMKIGKLGLEKTLEKHLIGTNAIQRYEVNAYGKRINQLEYQ